MGVVVELGLLVVHRVLGHLVVLVVPLDLQDQLLHHQLDHPDLLDQLDQQDQWDQWDHQDHKVPQDPVDHQEPQLHHHHHVHQSAHKSVFQLVHNIVVRLAEESRFNVLGLSHGAHILTNHMRLHHATDTIVRTTRLFHRSETEEIYFYTRCCKYLFLKILPGTITKGLKK